MEEWKMLYAKYYNLWKKAGICAKNKIKGSGREERELKVCFVYAFIENRVLYNLENCRQYRMRRRQNILFYMSVDKMKL